MEMLAWLFEWVWRFRDYALFETPLAVVRAGDIATLLLAVVIPYGIMRSLARRYGLAMTPRRTDPWRRSREHEKTLK